jgi:hypothetical protein
LYLAFIVRNLLFVKITKMDSIKVLTLLWK